MFRFRPILPALTALVLVLPLPATAASKKKKSTPAAATPASPPARTLTNYYCTIWHEVTFDSAAAPVLNPAGYMPVPHMGNIAIYKETGTKLPRPKDMWEDDAREHALEHAPADAPLVLAPPDTLAGIDTTRGYVLNWLNPGEGGDVRYDFLTIREDHPGPRKPFFAGMGGNLYIGICDP
jgi:hypothetical protein